MKKLNKDELLQVKGGGHFMGVDGLSIELPNP